MGQHRPEKSTREPSFCGGVSLGSTWGSFPSMPAFAAGCHRISPARVCQESFLPWDIEPAAFPVNLGGVRVGVKIQDITNRLGGLTGIAYPIRKGTLLAWWPEHRAKSRPKGGSPGRPACVINGPFSVCLTSHGFLKQTCGLAHDNLAESRGHTDGVTAMWNLRQRSLARPCRQPSSESGGAAMD